LGESGPTVGGCRYTSGHRTGIRDGLDLMD